MIIDSIDVGPVLFGNTETLDKSVIQNTNPHGGVFLFRDSSWPTNDIRTYKVQVSQLVRDSLIDSIVLNLGKEITITDHYGDDYNAILLRPDVVISTLTDRKTCKVYELEFQFLITGEV